MKKVVYLIFFITLFFAVPLGFEGANTCAGKCSYYLPNCDNTLPVDFSNYTDANNIIYEGNAYDYNYFLTYNTIVGEYDEYVTTIPTGQKRIEGRYFFFTLPQDLAKEENVIFNQEFWSKYDDEGNIGAVSKCDPPEIISFSNITKSDFLDDKCECPKIYIQNYCRLKGGQIGYNRGPIVLGKYIGNQDATYNGMVLLSEESKLDYVEGPNNNDPVGLIPSKEVQTTSYSTNKTTIYFPEKGYNLDWHITITKITDPELFSGEFVATINYYGGSRYEKKTTGINISDIKKEDLDNLSNFVEKVAISESQLNACIDRSLYPEKYQNTQANEYSPKCEMSYKIKGEKYKNLSINPNSFRMYNTEGQPIECSDFDLDNGENLVQMLFTIIKIIAPVLVIIFGSLDFAKAIFQADEDKQKKAGKDFAKRLIAAALIFLIPTILEIILGVAFNWDEVIPSICIK